MMDKTLDKTGNGFHKDNSNKNRLRIKGMAILERENHPNITASYDYTTMYANNFFEEDVNELQYFELNKIAMGMTIYKKDEPFAKAKNGYSSMEDDYENLKNGSSVALRNYGNENLPDPTLTDVIWSRMDITNPIANRNAYIIKQYYNAKMQETQPSRVEKCNNFRCGFVSCCVMMSLAYAASFFYNFVDLN